MPKTMRVTVEIDVDDLPEDRRVELAADTMQEPPEELPGLNDYDAKEAAEALENITEDTSAELFAGSDLYVRFTECRVIDAEWINASPT